MTNQLQHTIFRYGDQNRKNENFTVVVEQTVHMKSTKTMVNQAILAKYLITDSISCFFTTNAVKKYNSLITRFARRNNTKEDLTIPQKLCRLLYMQYLDLYDTFVFLGEQK